MQNKMVLNALLLFVLNRVVCPSPFVANTASDDTWTELEDVVPRYKTLIPLESVSPCPPLQLPESQAIDFSAVQKSMFEPARNQRPVPSEIKPILLPTPSPVTTTLQPSEQKSIELLCHPDRIYVRVLRSMFTNPNAQQYLKVGTCTVNKATVIHYYFLYHINNCNVQRDENEDRVLYSNTLSYEPVTSEPVIREMGFSVELQCHYNKHFRSYSVGYHPKVQSGTTFMNLQSVASLRPVDVSFKPLDVSQIVVGQPMYFEANVPALAGKRLYLNMCYVTASPDSNAIPKYTVVDNYGCMVDGKNTHLSKFYPSNEKTTIRFSIGALMFKDGAFKSAESVEMFIHCEMTLGDVVPTASTKSCSYNTAANGWSELYGDNGVCACCDSSCPAVDPEVTMKISSGSWKVKGMVEQPAKKSAKVEAVTEALGGFETFWDVFDKLTR